MKSIFHIVVILMILFVGKNIFMVDGQLDWFRFCMVFGVPFGIPYMMIVVPVGKNAVDALPLLVLYAIIGAVFGCVIATVVLMKSIAYLVWFILRGIKRLLFG
jgi:hypothetical protein